MHGTYTPKSCRVYKHLVSVLAKNAMIEQDATIVEDKPLEVRTRFIFPMPKSRKNPWATSRPDLDNLYKAVTDAMNGIVYKDDSQIVRGLLEKGYEIDGEGYAEITVETI